MFVVLGGCCLVCYCWFGMVVQCVWMCLLIMFAECLGVAFLVLWLGCLVCGSVITLAGRCVGFVGSLSDLQLSVNSLFCLRML